MDQNRNKEVKKAMLILARRNVNISAVRAALYILEEKGFLSSSLGGATQKRGGKMNRYFDVTRLGFVALRESKEIKEHLWITIPELSHIIH